MTASGGELEVRDGTDGGGGADGDAGMEAIWSSIFANMNGASLTVLAC